MAEKLVFIGRAKTDDIPDPNDPTKTIPGPDRIFLEHDSDAVTRSLEAGDAIKYFLIRKDQPATALQPVTLKPGPRAPGRELEIAEIVAGGVVVGEAEVIKR